ncbi:glycoside hydrolase family 35 protein [Niallia sp. FSL W8-0635]|uniref:glycoside hydrolase family 35 protein n=1 Tax=Niallia sp. FSL W8-0635 TaxID=2975337 RepID=UPI0030F650E8
MTSFQIAKEFLLNGEEFKIISGAVHYFRVVPEYWEHSLFNLKALGCNTVETYIPWNLHEPQEGTYNFEGIANIENFVKTAEKLGLYVILRPSPYICAEWEFGGLPAWLLKDPSIRIRSSSSNFLTKVDSYYQSLFEVIRPLQVTHGGPVIMMQVENEYGSFGNDKQYLKRLKELMVKHGADVPLFTSDGAWHEALKAGSLLEEDILPTGNFGSKSNQNLDQLADFHQENNKAWPLMCMEFWDGWFNRWGDEIIRRDPEELADEVEELLLRGSINLYMFHGGTNFGFMNGCSSRNSIDLPQVTSYDYDALLTEWGEPTEKYFAVQKAIKKSVGNCWQETPRDLVRKDLGKVKLNRKVSLFNTLSTISHKVYHTHTLTMEELDQNYGYILYQTTIDNREQLDNCRVVDANDRVQVFADKNLIHTEYQETLGSSFVLPKETKELNILVENTGRVNYGGRLLSPTQRKGVRSGVMIDIHFHMNIDHYPLSLDDLSKVDFTNGWEANQPGFYEYIFELDELADTFLDCTGFGKGIAELNGFHLGRYWNIGPTGSLYIPAPLLNKGKNRLIIFETEGIYAEEIHFSHQPKYIQPK